MIIKDIINPKIYFILTNGSMFFHKVEKTMYKNMYISKKWMIFFIKQYNISIFFELTDYAGKP